MGIVNKRNAIVGWLTLKVGKRVVRKKAQQAAASGTARAGAPRPAHSRRPAACSSSGAANAAARARRASRLFRRAIADLVPYEPGKPVEEVQRELGLERVVKLASNEGPFGPFPAALEAIERAARELNRYPDGGVWSLRSALAERHDVASRRSSSAPAPTASSTCFRRPRSTPATRSSAAGRRSRAT